MQALLVLSIDPRGHKDGFNEVHVPVSQAEVAPFACFLSVYTTDPWGQHAWSPLHGHEALDTGPDPSLCSIVPPAM